MPKVKWYLGDDSEAFNKKNDDDDDEEYNLRKGLCAMSFIDYFYNCFS